MRRLLRESAPPSAAQIPAPRAEAVAVATRDSPLARGLGLAALIHVAVRALDLVVLFLAGALNGESAYGSLLRWDANWYRRIAEHGYGFAHAASDGRILSDYAFFPLYPGLERLVADISGLSVPQAGLAVSALSSVAAAAGIFLVGSRLFDVRVGVVLVALWSALPISIVQSMAYTESLFTALVAWCLYAILRQNFLIAGALACLAGLTRPTGAAIAMAVVVAAVLHLRSTWSLGADAQPWRDRGGPVLGAVIAPVGTISFLAYVGIREHDPFAYFDVADQWGNRFDGGAAFLSWIAQMLYGPRAVLGLLLCGCLVLLGWLVYRMVRDGYPAPVLTFSILVVLMALSTSGYFGSKPRYLLPVFPLLMPLAVWLRQLPTGRVTCVLIGLAAGSGAYGAIWLFGPGPP